MSLTSAKRLSEKIPGVWRFDSQTLFSETKATNSVSSWRWLSVCCLWQHFCLLSLASDKLCHDCISTHPHTDSIINSTSMSERRLHSSDRSACFSTRSPYPWKMIYSRYYFSTKKKKNTLKTETSSTRLSSAGCFPFLLHLRRQICHIWRHHLAENPVEASTSPQPH